MFSRQAGKNETSAQLELALMTLRIRAGGEGMKAAPTFRPQLIISIRRLLDRGRQAGYRPSSFRPRDGYAVQLGRARWNFLSAEPSASVAGHTVSVLGEYDEAQDLDEETYLRRFRPMHATTAAPTVL
jgi:hypothetical protein